jgi:hypothetical protein
VSPKTYPGPLANGVHAFNVRAQKNNATVSSVASLSWRVDTVAPLLSSIDRAGTSPASTGPLVWTVTFNEPVNGLTLANLALVTSNLSGTAPALTSVAPVTAVPSAAWTVKVATTGTTAVNGTIGLNLTSKASVRDAASNPLGGSVPVTGQAYVYATDHTPPPAPVFTNTPADATEKTNAQFNWSDAEAGVTYQCSLDSAGFASCSSSGIEYKNLSLGTHCVAVVALDAALNTSAPTTFCWDVTSSVGFTISGTNGQPLYPGAEPESLNLSISNSNNFAIRVTMLSVSIQPETFNATCSTSENFTVVHGLLSEVVIAAHSTTSLSEVGVAASNRPQIRMLETGVNQDSCKSASLHLHYSGSAVKA